MTLKVRLCGGSLWVWGIFSYYIFSRDKTLSRAKTPPVSLTFVPAWACHFNLSGDTRQLFNVN